MQGRALIIVGELDTNVDPVSLLQVVDALVRAHKHFEEQRRRFTNNHSFSKLLVGLVGCLPASTFTENVDHMSKARGALKPVALKAGLGALPVARFDGKRDLLMFIDRDVQIADDELA